MTAIGRVLAAVFCLNVVLFAGPSDTPQQPTFRTGVDVVAIDVRVVDSEGQPVKGLHPEDFVITVDRSPRTIVTTAFLEYPLDDASRVGGSVVPPHAAQPMNTNQVVRAPARSVVLFVDEENLRPGQGKWAADALARFVDRLPQDDRVGLFVPKTTTRLLPSTDRAAVKTALSRVVGHLAPVPLDNGMGPAEAFDRHYAKSERGPDIVAEQIVADVHQRTLGTLSGLMTLLDLLRAEPGAKTVVLVSEELPVSDHLEEVTQFNWDLRRLSEAAARAHATLYVLQLDRPLVDTGGVQTASQEQESSPTRNRDMRTFGLEAAASAAGGKRLSASGRPDGALDRLALELSGQYLLGMRTEAPDRDGKSHDIKVVVKRTGVEVRARQTFTYAVEGTVTDRSGTDAVTRILRAAAFESGIPIAVATYSLIEPGTAGQMRVIMTAEIDRGAAKEVPLTVGYTITDAAGDNAGAAVEETTLKPAVGHPDGPLVYLAACLVPPASYTLRLAAADANSRVGSVVHPFVSRPTELGPIRVGDLVVFDRYAVEPGKGRPSVSGTVADTLSGYVEAYLGQAGATLPPDLTARLEVADSATAPPRRSARMTVEGPDARGRLLFGGAVETAGLPAGDYVARGVFEAGGVRLGETTRPIRIVAGSSRPLPPRPAPAPNLSPPAGTPSASAASPAVAPSVLLEGLERDLRGLVRRQLSDQEREQCDQARSFVQRARNSLRGGRNENEIQQVRIHAAAIAPIVRRQLKLDELMSAAAQYPTGKTGAAIQRVSDLLASQLEAAVRYLEDNRARFGVEGTPLADVNERVLGALCLLETEAAFLGGEEVASRLALARRLLTISDPDRLVPRLAEDWFVAVAGYLQGEFRLMDLMLHVEDGLRRFPDRAEPLVAAGMFYELLGSAPVELPAKKAQSRIDWSGLTMTSAFPTASEEQYRRLSEGRRTGLAQAEALYRRALAADAGHQEAHLRLGRVLSLSGRSEAAVTELRSAARSPDPRIRYLASLFEGRLQESAGRMDLADASYRESSRACPNCLSAGVALSHVQRLAGQAEATATTLDAALERDAHSARADYWWDYPLGAFWRQNALIAALRQRLQ